MPETLRQTLDGLQGKFVIAYTGAIGVPNGLDAALDGMQRLAERDPAGIRSRRIAVGRRGRLQRRPSCGGLATMD